MLPAYGETAVASEARGRLVTYAGPVVALGSVLVARQKLVGGFVVQWTGTGLRRVSDDLLDG